MSRPGRAGLLSLLACLAVVVAITVTAPDPAEDARRAWDDVAVGGWGHLDHVDVRVDRVQRTRVATTPYDRSVDSEATLVVVDYRAVVTGESMSFSEVFLQTRDGHEYEPRPEFPGSTPTQPGFTRRDTLVFEVPDARVAGARLVVDQDAAAFDVYGRAVRVDLGLSREETRSVPVAVPEPVTEVTP